MSSTTTKLLTADELLMMPDDGFHYELVRGELKRMTPPGIEHGGVTMELASALHRYVKVNKLGRVYAAETGFKLERDPDTVRAPDISFIRAERIESTGRVEGYGEGAPDLAVEVLSPGNKKREMAEKIEQYFASGARAVWIVNPKSKTVTVYRTPSEARTLTDKDMLDGGDVVRGFQFPVAEIFAL